MIQRSKIDVIFFSGVFDAMFIFGTSQSWLIRELTRDITVALPAQQRCAQTISANVLNSSYVNILIKCEACAGPSGYGADLS